MFGLGFWEIFLIVIVAIIALGPEKLPTAMVDVAKFFRKIKSAFDDAKSTLDQELKLTELKAEADKYKQQYETLKGSVNAESIEKLIDAPPQETITIVNSAQEDIPASQEPLRQKVSFKKQPKQQEQESNDV